MPGRDLGRLAAVLFVLTVSGCGAPGSSPPAEPSPSSSAAASTGAAGELPAGCEPIELRDPTGAPVVLDGQWTEVGSPDTGRLMTWWLFTQGTCIWGAGQVDEVHTGDVSSAPDQVQSLTGHIASDFTITGALLWLGPTPPFTPGPPMRYASVRMLIEFDDARQIQLRDTREPGVPGPHCPQPQGFCPDPLVLERVE